MIRAFLVLLLVVGLTACDRQTSPPQPDPSPALWVVESAGGEPVGWLFGTIHALPGGTRWETPALAAAIAEAGTLVVEASDLDPGRIAAVLDRLARDTPGPPLAERLPPPARADLARVLDRTGTPSRQFDDLETWAAALALSRLGSPVPAGNGVDKALLTHFARRPVVQFESAAAQLAIFDALPETAQRSLLAAVLAEQGDAAYDAQALAKAWLTGDLPALERITQRSLLADPVLRRALATDRNAAWTARLLPMLAQGRQPLVAVGAAHMLGADGLPAMVAAAGYRVRRIQ